MQQFKLYFKTQLFPKNVYIHIILHFQGLHTFPFHFKCTAINDSSTVKYALYIHTSETIQLDFKHQLCFIVDLMEIIGKIFGKVHFMRKSQIFKFNFIKILLYDF